jgi:hypothetical protein
VLRTSSMGGGSSPKRKPRTPQSPRSPGKSTPARPQIVLLGVPSVLSFPLEIRLEGTGCRVSNLADDEDDSSARRVLQRADVLLIGRRRPGLVAAQSVKSGCILLDLGLDVCSAPSSLVQLPQAAAVVTAAAAAASDGRTPRSRTPDKLRSAPGGRGADADESRLAPPSLSLPASLVVDEPPLDMRDVQCLCCSDGLAAMTAVLRMRNATHAALLLQGFIEPQEPAPGAWA